MAPVTRRTASAISGNASGEENAQVLPGTEKVVEMSPADGSRGSAADSPATDSGDNINQGVNESFAGPPGTSGGDKVLWKDPSGNLLVDTPAKDNAGGNKDTESSGLSSLSDENPPGESGEALLKTPAPSVTPGLAPPNTPMDLDDGVGAGDQANALKDKDVPKNAAGHVAGDGAEVSTNGAGASALGTGESGNMGSTIPTLKPETPLDEFKDLHKSYSLTKAAIEASIASHVSETSPLLKSFAETFLKGLNAFLDECSSRIAKAETKGISLIEMVDLTLDDTDIEKIKAPKRKRTGLDALKFNKFPRLNTAAEGPSDRHMSDSEPEGLFGSRSPTPLPAGQAPKKNLARVESGVSQSSTAAHGAQSQTSTVPPGSEAPHPRPSQAHSAPTPSQSQPPASQATTVESSQNGEKTWKKVPERFTDPLSYQELFVEKNQFVLELDISAMKHTISNLKKNVRDISENIHGHMAKIIGHNVKFYLEHGGYKVGSFKLKTTSPELVALCSMACTKEFQSVIRACPRLIQLDGNDPFYQSGVFNFKTIKELRTFAEAKETEGSWKALLTMMCRSADTTSETYFKDEHGIKASVNRVHALIERCMDPLQSQVEPKIDSTSPHGGFEQALQFIAKKCEILGVGANSTSGSKGNGLQFLQKRIWETLMGVLLMNYMNYREVQTKKIAQDANIAAVKGKGIVKKDIELKDLYKNIGLEMTTAQWGKMRQGALGAASIFLAFGPVGWFGCFADTNKFNLKSVYGMINLARHKSDWITKSSPPSPAPPEDYKSSSAWSNISALTYSCLESFEYHLDESERTEYLDWSTLIKVWNDKLTNE
ncbi:Golgi to ER traffic- protein [Puccinia graminis f. sp. tritici]|uniref:Golgi to ER traffic-protein n=1 Tax=Puccinia graminis f. sp. tritici TaxID=56615 RepID=A0A5B0LYN0_PUCGR|nr:Golgi to ER traffic- protein [Puccinia graminis f. sp. tritici]